MKKPSKDCITLLGFLMPNIILTMNNQKQVFTERAAAAMKVLVDNGWAVDEKADNGYPESRSYSITPEGLEVAKEFYSFEASDPNFSLTMEKFD
jgi:hypothetical protein